MAKAKGEKITDKQRKFAAEYLIDLNATQAAIRAGYSQKTAYRIGAELLQKTSVSEFIQKKMAKREERTEITQDMVLKQYARLAFFDIRKLYDEGGSLKPIHELDDESATALAGVEAIERLDSEGSTIGYLKKVKLVDRRAALADVARHLGMFTDKVELSGSVDLARVITEARKRAGG